MTKGTLANAPLFFTVSAGSVIGLLVAWFLYRVAMPIIIERMSS